MAELLIRQLRANVYERLGDPRARTQRLEALGLDEADAEEALYECRERVDDDTLINEWLTQQAGRKVQDLSGGFRRRVQVARQCVGARHGLRVVLQRPGADPQRAVHHRDAQRNEVLLGFVAGHGITLL